MAEPVGRATMRSLTAEVEALRAQAVRLRAEVILRDTALMWARERRAVLEAAHPGLARRIELARRVDALTARVHELMRERPAAGRAAEGLAPGAARSAGLEDALAQADLVICQAGCLSQGAYWRVRDHCKRTGKTCVLVDRPDAVRIVRIPVPEMPAGDARPVIEREEGA